MNIRLITHFPLSVLIIVVYNWILGISAKQLTLIVIRQLTDQSSLSLQREGMRESSGSCEITKLGINQDKQFKTNT